MHKPACLPFTQALRITSYKTFFTGLGALFLLVFFCSFVAAQSEDFAQEYVFSSVEDHLYENPANWSPAYPGTAIPRNAIVFIEGTAFITGYDLRIHGALRVGIGASLHAASSDLVIEAGGRLINDGELLAGGIRNFGMLNNNLSAVLSLSGFESFDGSMTNNLMSAAFLISGDVVNGGIFNNYSRCSFEKEFENKATFNQIKRSELMLKGNRVSDVGDEAAFSLERP